MDGMTPASPPVLPADKLRDLAAAGGKAAALAALAGTFDVPAFFVIDAGAFGDDGLAPEATPAVRAALAALGDGPFAVRSSGREEDGSDSAHAGQFATELNVPAADVPAAAHRVWRSGFTSTLAEYRRARGLSDAPQPPAVLVQLMVRPRAAGVAFSVDPVSGDPDVCVVSATAGLADRLVAGEIDGDSYRIGPDGATLDMTLAGDAPVLNGSDRAAVAALARRAAAHFGPPQDVEWAIDGAGVLKLLQARPVTTLGAPPPEAAAASDHQDALTVWDNSNIVESYPGVASPLTFSFARYVYAHVYQAFSRLMGVGRREVEQNRAVFENLLGRIDGRIYYNLLNWYRALALFPGFKANRSYMEQMMGVSEALPEALARRIAPPAEDPVERLLDRLSLARVAAGLLAQALALDGTIRRFEARLGAALATPDDAIAAASLPRLAGEYRALEAQLLARWDAPLVNDFLCMVAFGASRRVMERWAGAEGVALHAEAMIGQGGIISAEPARRIREMGALAAGRPDIIAALVRGDVPALAAAPGLAKAVASYLDRFGDRCTEELKLESRTLHEDPAQLLLAIAAAARAAPDFADPVAEKPTADARIAALFVGRPARGAVARRLVRWAGRLVRNRENLRFERTRLFGRVRRIFLAAGARLAEAGRLDDPRDVFLLTVEEVLGAVEGGAVTLDLRGLAELRRREDAADRARPDPPERLQLTGAHVLAARAASSPGPAAAGEGSDDRRRTGVACCRGVVTARVRVVRDPRTEGLEPGEILVARHTDPGWIAVFANAAGVIAERGSLLSHSAIVAREMGVPCVVGVKGVASWLRTGDLVRLDGGAGVVEKVSGTEDAQAAAGPGGT